MIDDSVLLNMAATDIKILITGGSGYVAHRLMEWPNLNTALADLCNCKLNISQVYLLDLQPPTHLDEENCDGVKIRHVQADILNCDELVEAFKGIDMVLHLASYGMSGREQLHKDKIWQVNAQGTVNVIQACEANNVRGLVFTSTVNVVFGGQRIEGGDESLPYYDPDQRSWDNYGNSKSFAERKVLQANGSITADGKTTLKTSVLRLPGIYGPEERRHIPRVVGLMKQGVFKVTYGDNPLVDFIHVDNVCQGLLKVTATLLKPRSPVAGQVYFITDGDPINNFEFFRPLTEALNVSFPQVCLPLWTVFVVAFLVEMTYLFVHKLYDFQPLLCRAEVYKTGQTHYFSIDKAKRELGYTPQHVNDMTSVAAPYRIPKRPPSQLYNILVNVVLGFLIGSLLMSLLPMVT